MESINQERYNWVDWVKSITIFLVILGHMPMDSIVTPIIYSFHMPLFMLISGYLYKPQNSAKKELIKNLKTLIVPYFIYQLIFYPYWIAREHLAFHHPFNLYNSVIEPIVRIIQTDPIDLPTWFLFCLFLIKTYVYIIQKSRSFSQYLIITSCILSIFICYLLNKHSIFGTFVIHNFFSLQIFFFAGQFLKKLQYERWLVSLRKNMLLLVVLITLFYILIQIGYKSIYTNLYETITFYFIGFIGSAIILVISYSLNKFSSKLNYNISTGTMVILGLHWMFIGVINFTIEKYLHLSEDIIYPAYIAFLICIFIMFMNYPLILICKKYFPILLGKNHTKQPR